MVNAPVAVSGFTVALQLDNNGFEQVDQVNLNARLLAKLVTESYNAPPDPNVEDNPQGLLQDPEFAKLNPGARGEPAARRRRSATRSWWRARRTWSTR